MRSPFGGRRTLGKRLSASLLLLVAITPIALPFGARIAVAKADSSNPIPPNDGTAAQQGAPLPPARIAAHIQKRGVWVGGRARVVGRLHPVHAGERIAIERRSRGKWRTAEIVETTKHGRFDGSFKLPKSGIFPLRVKFSGDRLAAATVKRIGSVGAYRPGGASYYGPGGRTACGQTLTAATQGVAHKTLPCGTKVTLYYNGRTVRVPVIDRGPFIAGRDWDLTVATKNRLGFGSTGVVGSIH